LIINFILFFKKKSSFVEEWSVTLMVIKWGNKDTYAYEAKGK
jgi:hypothetical protein